MRVCLERGAAFDGQVAAIHRVEDVFECDAHAACHAPAAVTIEVVVDGNEAYSLNPNKSPAMPA